MKQFPRGHRTVLGTFSVVRGVLLFAVKLRVMPLGPHKADPTEELDESCPTTMGHGGPFISTTLTLPGPGADHRHTRKNNMDSETKRRHWLNIRTVYQRIRRRRGRRRMRRKRIQCKHITQYK
jgi:hypothetical protein